MPIWHFSTTNRHFSLLPRGLHWIFDETRGIVCCNRNSVTGNDSWLSFNKSRSTRDRLGEARCLTRLGRFDGLCRETFWSKFLLSFCRDSVKYSTLEWSLNAMSFMLQTRNRTMSLIMTWIRSIFVPILHPFLKWPEISRHKNIERWLNSFKDCRVWDHSQMTSNVGTVSDQTALPLSLARHPAKHRFETFLVRFLIFCLDYRRRNPQNDRHFKNSSLVSGRDVNYGKSKAPFRRFVLSPLKWMLLMPSDDFCNFLFPYHCIFNKHSKHKQREHEKCFSLSQAPVVRPIEVLKQLLNQNRIREGDGKSLRASASLSIFSGGLPTVLLPFFWCENNISDAGRQNCEGRNW